jgi:hypothetical protein
MVDLKCLEPWCSKLQVELLFFFSSLFLPYALASCRAKKVDIARQFMTRAISLHEKLLPAKDTNSESPQLVEMRKTLSRLQTTAPS